MEVTDRGFTEEGVEAFMNAELDRFKDGGDLVTRDEIMGKVVFWIGLLVTTTDDEKDFFEYMDFASKMAMDVAQQLMDAANVTPQREA